MAILDSSKVVDRTEAILRIPEQKNLIGSMGWFGTKSIRGDHLTFDVMENSVRTLNDSLRSTDKRNSIEAKGFDVHSVHIPHYSLESVVTREQIGGIRAFDSEAEKQVATAVAEHLADHSANIDLHHEWQMANMLINAQLVTQEHSTYDMAAELGIAQGTMELTGATNPGDTLQQFRDMQRTVRDAFNGGRVGGYLFLAGDDLFDRLIQDGDILNSFEMFQATAQGNPLMNMVGEVGAGYQAFTFGNCTIINYQDSFSRPDGTTDQPLGAQEGLFTVRGQVGNMYYGSENTLQGLSRAGQRAFSRTINDEMGRFVNCYSETNSLPLLLNPGATIKVTHADFA